MALTTRKERIARRNDALERWKKAGGWVKLCSHDYKITRRSANLDIQWASAKLVQNHTKPNVRLLAWFCINSTGIFEILKLTI